MRICVLACALLGAAGCELGEPGGPSEPPADPGSPEASDIPTNGLDLQAVPLAALSSRPLVEWADGLAELEGGDELASYVASCALPAGEALGAGGAAHPGYYGLAPEWMESECDAACRGWISACLLAHANARDTPVEIAAVGPHPALADESDRTIQEAAFYGDVFAAVPEMYACAGSSIFEATESVDGYLQGRVCGLGQCGLVSTGTCDIPTLTGEADIVDACEVAAGERGAFDRCQTTDPTDPPASQVITVYL